jgi:hypothetical protein
MKLSVARLHRDGHTHLNRSRLYPPKRDCAGEFLAWDEIGMYEEDELTGQIWVNTVEAVQLTGYSYVHIQKLARDNWNLPKEERLIRVRRRSGRYDLWLPDLYNYIEKHGAGPQPRLNQDT